MIARTTAQDGQPEFAKPEDKALELVWIDIPHPVMHVGLAEILEKVARVHDGGEAPVGESPSLIILGTGGVEDLTERVKRLREANLGVPVLVFDLSLDLPLAWATLQAGARGFIHGEMRPEQIIRALKVAKKGEIAAPRELLGYLIAEDLARLGTLSARQREILRLVNEGLTNAQIAKKLFLTESTIKQHLRGAYKLLGVSNRTVAARLVHNNDGANTLRDLRHSLLRRDTANA